MTGLRRAPANQTARGAAGELLKQERVNDAGREAAYVAASVFLAFPVAFGCRSAAHAAVSNRQTGMPSFLALSARFPVMPEPGKMMTPFGIVARS